MMKTSPCNLMSFHIPKSPFTVSLKGLEFRHEVISSVWNNPEWPWMFLIVLTYFSSISSHYMFTHFQETVAHSNRYNGHLNLMPIPPILVHWSMMSAAYSFHLASPHPIYSGFIDSTFQVPMQYSSLQHRATFVIRHTIDSWSSSTLAQRLALTGGSTAYALLPGMFSPPSDLRTPSCVLPDSLPAV